MSAPASALAACVRDHANRVYSLVAKEFVRDDLVERMQVQTERWTSDRTSVVVAGDIKRGKTSLINALLGSPGLLPVDVDVATSVQLLIRYADALAVVVTRVTSDGSTESFDVGTGDLADYASMRGDPDKRRDVTNVEVAVPHELLRRGLVILDTPGVGGMTPGHRDITLAGLNLADVLLFTISTDGPVLRTELEFLAEASERIDNVVLVLTKTDAEHDWAALLEENRDRLREYATQLEHAAARPDADDRQRELARRFTRLLDAPFLPVSSRLALLAQERTVAGRAEAGARLAERSGLPALQARLDRMISTGELMRLANVLQMSASITAALGSEEEDRVRGAEQDPELDARLEAEQAELNRFASKQARWRQRFGYHIQRIQIEATRVLSRELSVIETRYRKQLGAGDATLSTLAGDLEKSLIAAWSTVASLVRDELECAVTSVGDELGIDQLRVPVDELASPEAVRGLDQREAQHSGGFDFVDDGVPTVLTTFTLGSIATALGMTLAGGWIVGAVLAGGIAVARYRKRAGRHSQQEDVQELREALASIRQECTGELSTRLPSLRMHMEDEIQQRIGGLEAELAQRRKALGELVRRDRARREQVKRRAQRRLSELRKLQDEADGLREQVHAALGS